LNAKQLTEFVNQDIPNWTNFIKQSGITLAP
jgi:hypothetical protein